MANTWDWLRDALADVPEDEARLILGENAVRLYGLDRDALVGIAEQIGPQPSEILGGAQPIDSTLIANFHHRSGYERSFEDVDVDALATDLGLTSAP